MASSASVAYRSIPVILLLFGASPSALRASLITELILNSQPGDFIGQGQTYDFTPANGTFVVAGSGPNAEYSFLGNVFGVFADVDFAAPGGVSLVPGIYLNAARFPFQGTQPGLNVDLNGRGSNTLTGAFTVLEAIYAPNRSLQNFGVNFTQTDLDKGSTGSLSGTFYYQFDPDLAAPEPKTLELVLLPIIAVWLATRRLEPRRRA
jgi:hypothetical protein